jgi:PAS domain S-box-containing protein
MSKRLAPGPPTETEPTLSRDAPSLASLLGLAYDAILVRSPDSRVVFWNTGAEALYGWSRTEALGQRSHELLETRFPCPLAEIERELTAHGRWEGRLLHRTKAGEQVTVDSRWAAHRSAEGELLAVMEVDRDSTARVTAERQLAEEAARFRALFDSSLDAILLTAPDGRILAANGAAQRMFGRSEEEIVAGGRELLVDLSDPRLADLLRTREATGCVRGDLRMLRRDGTPFETEVSSVVFADAAGELRTSMVVHDVSERAEALQAVRESEGRFRALAEAAFEAVVIHDFGRILDVNPAASALFGYPEAELRRMRVLDLVAPNERDRARALMGTGPGQRYETSVMTASGERLHVEVSARSITFKGKATRVAAVRDITEREQARKALEVQNQRLLELDTLKSEFIALISHELRTPLTSIIAHLDVLEGGEAGAIDARPRRYLQAASRNAKRLQRLVDDLLLLARAEAGEFTLEREPVGLAPLAEEVVEGMRPIAAGAGIGLRTRASSSPVVNADRDRIAQVLNNLATNALNATAAGGSVEIHVETTADEAMLIVSDTGTGISAAEQLRLFDRFYRTQGATSRSTGGAGLGLAIVKMIVEAHDGSIEVDSEPGQGSTFTVRLPLDR